MKNPVRGGMFVVGMQINIMNTVRCEMFVAGMQINIMNPVRVTCSEAVSW